MNRLRYLDEINDQFRVHPVCAILGPRQVGKTTLAKAYIKKCGAKSVRFFDLENPFDLMQLQENPMLTLSEINAPLIVIDEIQLRPNLFSILRVLVDQRERKQRFLILGSASRDFIQQSSQTLAGRIGYIELPPFTLTEVKDSKRLYIRGGYPNAYLADSDADSMRWRQSYISTFLERDIPNLGFSVPPATMRRFWLMLAHYHGQTFNASELGRSLEISDHTARRYLDILSGTFMVRILQPWFASIQKRQVKSPKIYFRDSGILNALIGIHNEHELSIHPRLGSFWEGFAIEQAINAVKASTEECYFWATQADAELDLLIIKNGKRIGFECKYTQSPKITKSMRIALEDLSLEHLVLIYPGRVVFPLAENITACGLDALAKNKSIFFEKEMK